jgi:hypothetical protein
MKRHRIKIADRDKVTEMQDWLCADCGDGRTLLFEHEVSPTEFFRLCANCSEVYSVESSPASTTQQTKEK